MLGRVIQLVPRAHLPDALVALRPSLLQLAVASAASAGGEAQCLHAAHAWAALVASSAAGMCMYNQDMFIFYSNAIVFLQTRLISISTSILIDSTYPQSPPRPGPN